jgi:hypothetical protein
MQKPRDEARTKAGKKKRALRPSLRGDQLIDRGAIITGE